MKNKVNILILLIIFMIPSTVLAAGSASGSAPTSVEKGSNVKFTVTIHNTAAWNLKLSGTGATSGCSQSFADVTADGNNTTKNLTITCNSNNIGNITFTATGDITSSDGTNSNVSITKVVNVVKPREKETEARLSSLKVEGYQLNFNKDNYNYSINAKPEIKGITISANAISGRASISGTGYKELSPEGGKYEIICTAENGTRKIYTINVAIIDDNPIKVTIDGKNYNVVKTNKVLKAPSGTKEQNIKINEIEVPAYFNEKSNITIVGLKDEQSNIKYAIYNNGEYKLYNENKSSETLLYIDSKKLDGYKETTIVINDIEYSAYELNDRFKIVYAMNLNNGEYNYYRYDTKENIFQYYELNKEEIPKEKENNTNIYLITTIIFLITTLISLYYAVFLKLKERKQIKKENTDNII